jgi:hypothetical protein
MAKMKALSRFQRKILLSCYVVDCVENVILGPPHRFLQESTSMSKNMAALTTSSSKEVSTTLTPNAAGADKSKGYLVPNDEVRKPRMKCWIGM